MGHYDVAQICRNGHVINASSEKYPEHNLPFCERCGAPTIVACPNCGQPIRGEYHVEGVIAAGFEFPAPGFCAKCGHAYPWTAARLEAARALADDLDALSGEEREVLKKSLDDLVRDTPQTQVAAQRFKKFAATAGKQAADGLRAILIDVVSEAAKKALWPTP